MTILLFLLIFVLVLWVLGLWLKSGEDLTAYDHAVEPRASESFSSRDGPSAEHHEKVAELLSMGSVIEGMGRVERLAFVRQFMEDVPRDKSFNCDFVPVDAGGVPAEWVLAPGADPSRRVYYIHGGAFIAGSPNSHRTITSAYSEIANAAVLAVDYRLMPENRRRDGIEDCQAVYRWILDNGPGEKSPPSRLYISGDSAGGNLSLVMSNWIRDEGLRAPDAVIALSPLTDSTYSGPSIRNNLLTDTMLGPMFGKLMKVPRPVLAWIYLLTTRYRPSNPQVSPLFGDLANLPPTLVHVSESEMLLDDARRYVNKARAAGSPAFLQTWAEMLHVWHIFHPEVPESRQAFEQIAKFLERVESKGF